MKYLLVSIVAIAIVGAVLYLILKRKKDKNNQDKTNQLYPVQGENLISVDNNELDIQMEMLPEDSIKDDTALVEIKDSNVLARIDSAIPEISKTILSGKNAYEDGSEKLYRVIVPKGAKLVKSRERKDAVRGMYRGAKGIKGHANLVEAQKTGLTVANSAATVANVASFIVGQYYMNEINSKLEEISEGIDRIESFQEDEYRSKVFALVAQVKKTSEFNSEIIDNKQLINRELTHLDELEHECIELLGQANIAIVKISEKKGLDFKTYEEEIKRTQTWYEYQQILLEVLYRIADLKYVFQFGNESRKRCGALLSTYTKQVSKADNKLIGWHEFTAKRLEVDIPNLKRRRTGFDRAIHWVPGRFVKSQNYRSLEKNTANMIESQINGKDNTIRQDKSDLFNEDVQIISKDGKLYYLPNNKS